MPACMVGIGRNLLPWRTELHPFVVRLVNRQRRYGDNQITPLDGLKLVNFLN